MSDDTPTMLAGPGPREALRWEELGRQSPARAFRLSLTELILHPLRFFDRMATEGGLREPLMFFWIMSAAMILLGFPLALAHFGLTAPDPAVVSPETYHLHLLAPRVTGFAAVLLPVILLLGGTGQVVAGTLFHLAARLFGARNWEGSVSIWLYAKSAAGFPFVAAEALLCGVTIAAYVTTLAFPAAAPTAAQIARLCPWILLAAGAISAAEFVVCAVSGCVRAFDLEPANGAAAALAGTLLTALVFGGPAVGWLLRGAVGASVAGGVAFLLVIGLAVVGSLLPVPEQGDLDENDSR